MGNRGRGNKEHSLCYGLKYQEVNQGCYGVSATLYNRKSPKKLFKKIILTTKKYYEVMSLELPTRPISEVSFYMI